MTTEAVAKRFYELAKVGDWDKIQEELFSKDAKSLEPAHAEGLGSVSGMDQIKEKGKQWQAMIEETHGGYCKEPQVGGNYFCCAMGADVTMKGQGRINMDEVAVYEVKDGKIVTEQFFY
ncbi:MAG: nuclear transport factor 2 family protein [Cyclobacteriaceae bacterium]